MTVLLHSGGQQIALSSWQERPTKGTELQLRDERAALQFVQQLTSSCDWAIARNLLAEAFAPQFGPVNETQLIEQLARAIANGSVRVISNHLRGGGWAISISEPEPAPSERGEPQEHWITFIFHYPNDEPVVGLDYVWIDPSGARTDEMLADSGEIDKQGVDPGVYQVVFKELEAALWEPKQADCDDEVKVLAVSSGFDDGTSAAINIYREHSEREEDKIDSLSGQIQADRLEASWSYDYDPEETGVVRLIAEVVIEQPCRAWVKTAAALELQLKNILRVEWADREVVSEEELGFTVETEGFADGAEVAIELWERGAGAADTKVADLDPLTIAGGCAAGSWVCDYPDATTRKTAVELHLRATIDDGRVVRKATSGAAVWSPPVVERTWLKLKVVDHDSSEPIANVRLRLTLADGSEGDFVTDAKGMVCLQDVAAGSCSISSEIEGKKWVDTLVVVSPGATKFVDCVHHQQFASAGPFELLDVEAHKVATDESIASLADVVGISWQQLAYFNWGTDDENQINASLSKVVGCTKMVDELNYRFDDSDEPGIVYLPWPYQYDGFETEQEHVIRVKRAKPPPVKEVPKLEKLFVRCDHDFGGRKRAAENVRRFGVVPEAKNKYKDKLEVLYRNDKVEAPTKLDIIASVPGGGAVTATRSDDTVAPETYSYPFEVEALGHDTVGLDIFSKYFWTSMIEPIGWDVHGLPGRELAIDVYHAHQYKLTASFPRLKRFQTGAKIEREMAVVKSGGGTRPSRTTETNTFKLDGWDLGDVTQTSHFDGEEKSVTPPAGGAPAKIEISLERDGTKVAFPFGSVVAAVAEVTNTVTSLVSTILEMAPKVGWYAEWQLHVMGPGEIVAEWGYKEHEDERCFMGLKFGGKLTVFSAAIEAGFGVAGLGFAAQVYVMLEGGVDLGLDVERVHPDAPWALTIPATGKLEGSIGAKIAAGEYLNVEAVGKAGLELASTGTSHLHLGCVRSTDERHARQAMTPEDVHLAISCRYAPRGPAPWSGTDPCRS